MGRLGIERQPSKGFCQFQIRLAYFEKNLNRPAFSINADDVIFRKGEIGRNQNQVIISFIPVSDKDKSDRYRDVVFLNRGVY